MTHQKVETYTVWKNRQDCTPPSSSLHLQAAGPHVCHQLSSTPHAGWLLAGGSRINIHLPSLSASQHNKSEGWKCQRGRAGVCFRRLFTSSVLDMHISKKHRDKKKKSELAVVLSGSHIVVICFF